MGPGFCEPGCDLNASGSLVEVKPVVAFESLFICSVGRPQNSADSVREQNEGINGY